MFSPDRNNPSPKMLKDAKFGLSGDRMELLNPRYA
jgi:hypothetical protein